MRRLKKMLPVFMLAMCMMCLFPVRVKAAPGSGELLADQTVNAMNYFKALVAVTSGNNHFIAEAIYVDEKNQTHIIMSLNKNSTRQDIKRIVIAGQEVVAPTLKVSDIYTSITVQLPGNEDTKKISGSGNGVFDITLGNIDLTNGKNKIEIYTDQGGWSIDGNAGATIEVKFGGNITKNVDKNTAKFGEELTYTITVTNSDAENAMNIYDAYVTDVLPEGLIINEITSECDTKIVPEQFNGKTNVELSSKDNLPNYKDGKQFALIHYLPKGGTVTFTVKATVNHGTIGGLHNIAHLYVSSVELNDTADTVVPYFAVTHSSDGVTEYIEVPTDNQFDITQAQTDKVYAVKRNEKFEFSENATYGGVRSGYLYGGLCTGNSWLNFREDVCGVELNPKAGDTFYMKEVSYYYLLPNTLTVHWDQTQPFAYTSHMITAIDGDYYKEYGFMNTANKPMTVCDEIQVLHTETGAVSRTITVQSACGRTEGFLLEKQIMENSAPLTGTESAIIPYYITMDNVRVPGVFERTLEYNGGLSPVVTDVRTTLKPQKADNVIATAFVNKGIITLGKVAETEEITAYFPFSYEIKNQKKATTVHLLSAIEDKDGTVGFEYCVNGVTKKVEAKVHPSNGNKAASTFKDVELSKGARLFYYDLSLEKADEIVVRPYRTDADGVTVWGENQTIKLGR